TVDIQGKGVRLDAFDTHAFPAHLEAYSCSTCGCTRSTFNSLPIATVTSPPYDPTTGAGGQPLKLRVQPLETEANYLFYVCGASTGPSSSAPTNVEVKTTIDGVVTTRHLL